MKLHLPKQLFSALLTAIAFAAPATLTLGSVAQGEGDTYWNITSSAYTTTETTIKNGTTIYLGNGTDDGSGSGNANTKFESGKFTIESGGKLFIHGWTTKDLTINAGPKLEIASEIELQSGGTLHMQDGSYYFSNTVAVSGTVNIKSQWDKGHVFNALTGNASSIINMSGHSTWATTFALQGEGKYAGRINLTGGSSSGATVLAINSASALASTAAINLSGQYTNLAMNTASQTLSSIAGNGTIMLANAKTLGGSAVSSELTISNTAAGSDVFTGTIASGITVKVANGSYQTFGSVTNNGTLTFESGSNVTLNGTIAGTGTTNLNGSVTIGSLDGLQYEVLDGTLSGEGGDHGFRTGNVKYLLVDGANTTGSDFSVTLDSTDITDKLSKTDNALEYVLSTTRTIYEILDTHTETVVYDGVNGESATATGFELAGGTTLELNSSLAGSVTDGISIADSVTATIKVVKTGETTPSLSSTSVKLGASSSVDYVVDGGTLNLYSDSGTNSLSVTNNGVVNVNGANHVLGSTDKRVLVALGEGGNISFANGGGGAAHMDVTVTGTGILTGSWQGNSLNVQGTITGEQGSTLQLAQRSGSTNTWTISSAISGALAVTSNALVTLSGTNTHTGGTTITGGTLTMGNAQALGTEGGVTMSGGTLKLGVVAAIKSLNVTDVSTLATNAKTLTVNGDISTSSKFIVNGGGTLKVNGNLTTTGTFTLGTTEGTSVELYGTGNSVSIFDLSNGGYAKGQIKLMSGSKTTITSTNTGQGNAGALWMQAGTSILLEKDASLSWLGATVTGKTNDATISTSADRNVYLEVAEATIDNADVSYNGTAEAYTVAAKLTNSSITQNGSGTLTVNNSGNTLTAVNATGGNVKVINTTENAEMSIASVSAAAGKTVTIEVANLTVGTLNAAEGTVELGSGATITLGDGVNASTSSIGTVEASTNGNTIHLNDKATLDRLSNVTGTVTLSGSGVYDLGSVTDLGSGNNTIPNVVGETVASLQDATNWTGTVKLAGTLKGGQLNNLGNANSTIKLAGISGHLHEPNHNSTQVENLRDAAYGTTVGNVTPHQFTANLELENASSGNTTTAAFDLNDGYSESIYEFCGDISGSGSMKWSKSSVTNQMWIFSGDVSDWEGQFYATTGSEQIIRFTGDATTIATSVGVTSGNLLAQIYNAADVTVNGIFSDKLTTLDGTGDGASGSLKLHIDNKEHTTTFNESVSVDELSITENSAVNFKNQLSVSSTLSLGSTATITGKDSGAASMTKVSMSTAGISSSATDGTKGTISNANVEIAQLAEDASFTIQDMTLTNTTISAATPTTQVKLQNVVATNLELAQGKFTMNAAPMVGTGGTTAEFGSGVVSLLTVGSASLTLNLDVMGAYESTGAVDNVTLTITLAGITGDVSSYDVDAWKALVGFEESSWLGQALTGAQYSVADVATAAEGGVPSVSYGYAATGGEGSNVGTLTITITGLNVPEPASATLGLAALMMLCARRRRKA